MVVDIYKYPDTCCREFSVLACICGVMFMSVFMQCDFGFNLYLVACLPIRSTMLLLMLACYAGVITSARMLDALLGSMWREHPMIQKQ